MEIGSQEIPICSLTYIYTIALRKSASMGYGWFLQCIHLNKAHLYLLTEIPIVQHYCSGDL